MKREPSTENWIVDSGGLFSPLDWEQEMMERQGFTARVDYNGEYMKKMKEEGKEVKILEGEALDAFIRKYAPKNKTL